MPEFKQLLATITLNLFKTIIESKFPGRRKTKNGLLNINTNKLSSNSKLSLSYYNKRLSLNTNNKQNFIDKEIKYYFDVEM